MAERVYVVSSRISDQPTISSFLGISGLFATIVFFLTTYSLDLAKIHFQDLLHGKIHFHGDTSLLNFAIFLNIALIILTIQYKFSQIEDKE